MLETPFYDTLGNSTKTFSPFPEAFWTFTTKVSDLNNKKWTLIGIAWYAIIYNHKGS